MATLSRITKNSLFWPAFSVSLIAIGFFAAQFITPLHNPIPPHVASKLTYTPLVIPGNTQGISTTDYVLGPKDDSGQPFSFTVVINNKKLTVSEAPLPAPFNEIPEYKDRFIDSFILDRKTLSAGIGALYYGQPAQSQGYTQVAVATERGLLTIISTAGERLTENELRKIGDALTPAK